MEPRQQILLVAILLTAAIVVYIVCSCLPSKEEMKEFFNKMKKKKEDFICPTVIYEKLKKLYPNIFTSQKECNKIVAKIISPKDFANYEGDENKAIMFIQAYIINHPDEFKKKKD